jgi:predicted RNA-binding Zn-ribbon protein involved in translation (DUF1610 family)
MEPRIVHTARSNAEAEIIKTWLQQQGIQASIFNGEMNSGAFEIVETDPQVIVAAEDYERALEVIDDFRNELEQPADMSRVSDAEGQFDWPLCPICDEMRLARCQKCETVSSEFSTDESGDHDSVICLHCNEPTSIAFVDQCRFCDHDFTSEATRHVPTAHAAAEAANANRVLLLVAGLVLLFVVLAIWFVTAMR